MGKDMYGEGGGFLVMNILNPRIQVKK